MSKINKFKMDERTFLSQLKNCYAFYSLPNCIKNHKSVKLLSNAIEF